ncbi:hypothetical protein [Schlesneria sp. DSM 10557]|uniref:hypothetical protein n=1 Tax=Schlesneria sp. DSM 10557 TaxID=3044399 RepID=UPI00359F239A
MKPIENPLAYRLDKITRPTTDLIDQAADSVTEDVLLEHSGFQSFVMAETEEDQGEDGFRPATNEEAATLCYSWYPQKGEFDLRKPLPSQVAEWLREQSALMLAAAEAIETVPDDRDLDRIASMVNSETPAEEAVA